MKDDAGAIAFPSLKDAKKFNDWINSIDEHTKNIQNQNSIDMKNMSVEDMKQVDESSRDDK